MKRAAETTSKSAAAKPVCGRYLAKRKFFLSAGAAFERQKRCTYTEDIAIPFARLHLVGGCRAKRSF